jgi:3-dehydroquinate synthase
MESLERQITVSWRHRVIFTESVFAPENDVLHQVLAAETRPVARALVVVDESLAQAQPGLVPAIERYFQVRSGLELACAPVVMEGGERVKNEPAHVAELHARIERHHLDRHSYLVAVGGGALLDMAGFAAATAHRGMRHVRLPTTTLSQADSGVGIKNGINAFGKKNFLGTFTPPWAVINDARFLASLSPRDQRGGLAEAVKVALILDAAFFQELERVADGLRHFEPVALRRVIRRCAEAHLSHIATSGDPFEFGTARPLDFGHWSAHKLEQLSQYSLRHGEAVAIGMALDVVYCQLAGYLSEADQERVLRLLGQLGFALFAPELTYVDAHGVPLVLGGLAEFQEHLGGELTITLLRGIGQGFEVHEMSPEWVQQALVHLRKRDAKSIR